MELFDRKEEVAHVAQSVRMENIEENDYNLSVSSYVEAKDSREVINITKLNQEIEATVSKIDGLRQDIDTIVAEIEGSEA
jgi:type I restriction enzyme M protein